MGIVKESLPETENFFTENKGPDILAPCVALFGYTKYGTLGLLFKR